MQLFPAHRFVFMILACPVVLAPGISAAIVPGQETRTQSQPQSKTPGTSASQNGSADASGAQPHKDVSKEQIPVVTNPKEEAWHVLQAGCAAEKVPDRASATRLLGLIPKDVRARKLAETALLHDPKPEVRAAAAAALGEMKSRQSIPELKKALEDSDPSVILAAAHSLVQMHIKIGFQVYSEVLFRERKGKRGLIASQLSELSDPKKMEQLGFEEAVGFIPFGGIGWRAFKEVTKDDSSPVRAGAATVLADDPDPATTKVLEAAAADKSWLVRAAVLEALAHRGDPSAADTVALYLIDENKEVKYTAAAAVLRLRKAKAAHSDWREESRMFPK